MKILELPAYFLPNNGGIEYCVYYLSKEFVKLGHQVTIISSDVINNASQDAKDAYLGKGIPETSAHGKISVKRLKSFTFLKTPIALTLKKAIMNEDFDLLVLHYPHPFFIDVGAYVARKKKKPYVVHCHGKEIELSGIIGFLGTIYNRLLFEKVLKDAAGIITNTNMVIPLSRFLTRYNGKIITIPHGVDCDRFKKIKTRLKEDLGLKSNKIILYVGALRWYKGLDVLLKAFKAILSQVPDARLIIVGKGEEEQRLKDLALRLSIKDQVIFQGFVDDSKLAEYYSVADLFILPSPTIEESFGLVALEACSVGLPAIVTSGAGVSEIFEKEQIGCVVKPSDPDCLAVKSIELLTNPKLCASIAKKSQQVIHKKYTWNQIAKRYISMFEEMR